MGSDGWLALAVALVAFATLAIAALVQTMLGRTSRSRVQVALGQEPVTGRQRYREMVDPRLPMTATMVLAQVLAGIIAASTLTYALDQMVVSNVEWLAIVLVVVFYLLFGQILPRAFGERDLEPYVDRLVGLGKLGSTLLAPVTWFVENGVRRARAAMPGSTTAPDDDEVDTRRTSTPFGDLEDLGESERRMIDGMLGLKSTAVRDIMVNRLDIVAVERTVPLPELIETITRAGHSRIPVYHQTLDRIVGILYAKDLLPFVVGNTQRVPLLDLIRPAYVVPESKRVTELFSDLKRTQVHLAVVADEYGGTAGLVTIEDILEEIVGEIHDEYDTEQPLFRHDETGVLIADGRLAIEDVEDALDLRFDHDDDFGTLGGFVLKHLGRLPVQGDSFEAEGVRVDVIALERHRVRELRLTRIEPEPDPAPEVIEEEMSQGRLSRFSRRDNDDKRAADERRESDDVS